MVRIFLKLIVLMTLLVVAGAVLFHLYGDRFLADQAMPTVEFEAPPPEEQPLYANLDNWLARPGIEEDYSQWSPEVVEALTVGGDMAMTNEMAADEEEPQSEESTDGEADQELPQVATFYVHPTTYLERDRWNGPMQLDGDNAFRTRLFVQTQASAFAPLGPIWAPRYRQAAYGAFLSRKPNAVRALDVAFQDIIDAFDIFLAENPDGPIIIAGHSQGALQLLRLLGDRGEMLHDRLVAAYIVGWPIDIEADLPSTGLPLCQLPDDSGCIMSWLTFSDPPNPGLVVRDWEDSTGFGGIERSRKRVACTNPITGMAESAGGEEVARGLGTLIPTKGLREAKMVEGAVMANCRRGLLMLDGKLPDVGRYVLPGNNYHPYDYALFWADIRRDARARATAWAAATP